MICLNGPHPLHGRVLVIGVNQYDHPDYQHQLIYLPQEFVLSTEKLKLKLDPYNIFDIHIAIFVAFIISK